MHKDANHWADGDFDGDFVNFNLWSCLFGLSASVSFDSVLLFTSFMHSWAERTRSAQGEAERARPAQGNEWLVTQNGVTEHAAQPVASGGASEHSEAKWRRNQAMWFRIHEQAA